LTNIQIRPTLESSRTTYFDILQVTELNRADPRAS